MTYEPPTPVSPRRIAEIINATVGKDLRDEVETLRADNARLRAVIGGMREWLVKERDRCAAAKRDVAQRKCCGSSESISGTTGRVHARPISCARSLSTWKPGRT